MRDWTPADIRHQLDRFGPERARKVADLSHIGHDDGIGPSLILAIGSRESWLRNIVGDRGHGRGFLMIDDRAHGTWLNRQAGCRDGEWTPQTGRRAGEAGYVPTLTASTRFAIKILRDSKAFAGTHGVPPELLHRAMIASYNTGAGNAVSGWRRGDVDVFTTGQNYSRDVLDRAEVIKRWLTQQEIH